MPLSAGTRISRYEIESLIGSGGMGEVYRARDTALGRHVAVKVLKKSNDPQRLHRFRREARAASALNHPNILSVYDFGRHGKLHFIVTEYLPGITLRQAIVEQGLTERNSLQIAIDVARTLLIAHRAGIVHRDIKPENIMLLPDGGVKILDFGLAKLNEAPPATPGNSIESTVSLLETKPGSLIGTVSYMSPEQLRGQPVDERTDLWSLGIVLFEMVEGRRPFDGSSSSDVIASVLERDVPRITNRSSADPQALNSIIAKALSKDRSFRYGSAEDFVKDLITIYGHASEEAPRVSRLSFGNSGRATAALPFEKSTLASSVRFRFLSPTAIGLLVALVGIAAAYYFYQNSPADRAEKQIRATTVPAGGNVINAVLSPDGRFIAYVEDASGQQTLRLRQVAENADSELMAPKTVHYAGLQFSPDSNAIYFTVFEGAPIGKLYRKPILGGSQQKILEDIDSPVSFSPVGNQLAFIRTKSHEGVDQIVVSSIDGTSSKVLAERKHPSRYSFGVREGLSWSSDGRTIAAAAADQDDSGERMTVVLIDSSNGVERPATKMNWFRVGRVIWGKDDESLIINAAEFGTDLYQIWRLSSTEENVRKITNEVSDYLTISQSSDGKLMLAVADDRSCNLFVAPERNPDAARQIWGGNLDGMGGVTWTRDGRVVFVSIRSGNRDIWISGSDGSGLGQLTFDKAADDYPSVSADGQLIAFSSSRTSVPHVWLMKIDGSGLRQITKRGSEAFPQIDPNGGAVYYSAKPLKIWKSSVDGGEPFAVTDIPANWVAVSNDGAKLAALTMNPGEPMKLSVFLSKNGKLEKTFDLYGEVATPSFPPTLRWASDGKSIAYVSTQNGVSNILMQRLTEKTPEQLTHFAADRIFAFDWSKDGNHIAFARGTARNKLLLFENY